MTENLPKLPIVFAPSMLVAQSVKFTAEERAAIAARKEFFVSMGMSPQVNINVYTVEGAHIGTLTFS